MVVAKRNLGLFCAGHCDFTSFFFEISIWVGLDITYFPTKFSSTDDLPADCPPTTAIWGKSTAWWVPREVKQSWILLIIGIRHSIPRLWEDIFTVCFRKLCLLKFHKYQSVNWLWNRSFLGFFSSSFTVNDFCPNLLPLLLSAWSVLHTVM